MVESECCFTEYAWMAVILVILAAGVFGFGIYKRRLVSPLTNVDVC